MIAIFNNKSFQKLFRDSSIVMLSKVGTVVLGFVTSILIARYYGAETIGVVTLINTFVAIFSLFVLLGTNTSILKLIPQFIVQHSIIDAYLLYHKILKLLILWGLILSVIIYLLKDILEIYIFKIDGIGYYIGMVAVFIIPISLKNYVLSSLRALKDIKIYAVLNFLSSVIILFGLCMFIFLFNSNLNPVYLYIIAPVIVCLLSIFSIKKLFSSKIESFESPSTNISIQTLVTTSFPMFLISGMHIVMSNTDIIMIGIYLSEKEIGFYSIALKIALLTSFVLSSINAVMAPKFSQYYHNGDMNKLKESVNHSSKLIFITTFPLLIVLIIFGKSILSIFGKEFLEVYYVMVILILGQMANSFFGSVGLILNMTNHSLLFQKIIFQGILINIVCNMTLIEEFGLYGAAIGTSIGIIYWNLVAYYHVKKIHKINTLDYLIKGEK